MNKESFMQCDAVLTGQSLIKASNHTFMLLFVVLLFCCLQSNDFDLKGSSLLSSNHKTTLIFFYSGKKRYLGYEQRLPMLQSPSQCKPPRGSS